MRIYSIYLEIASFQFDIVMEFEVKCGTLIQFQLSLITIHLRYCFTQNKWTNQFRKPIELFANYVQIFILLNIAKFNQFTFICWANCQPLTMSSIPINVRRKEWRKKKLIAAISDENLHIYCKSQFNNAIWTSNRQKKAIKNQIQ